jgi:hypothetical protein
MPSFDLSKVWDTLPELATLHIQNLDSFNKEQFLQVYRRLTLYVGLQTLNLELVGFELEEVKNELIEIFRIHGDFLKHLSLARNKVTNEFLKFISLELRGIFNVLESVDLRHLKELQKVNFVELLQAIALLNERTASTKRDKPLRVYLSDYQTQLRRGQIFKYLETAQPELELHFD